MTHEGKNHQIEFQFEELETQIDRETTNLPPILPESSSGVGEPPQQLGPENSISNKAELSQPARAPHDGPGALAVDFEEFSARLDEEIDEMLVASTPADCTEEPLLSLETPSPDHSVASPASTQSLQDSEETIEPSERETGFDFEAFAAQIDHEIDNLLIPSTNDADEDDKTVTPHSVAGGLSKPIKETPLDCALPHSNSKPTEETTNPEGEQVAALLEALSVAYLSLDWDFSEKNVINLKCALERLNQYCRQDKQIEALYKIFMMVVNRMKADRKSIDGQLLDFIREAQALLKLLLLSGHTNGAYEKEQLKKLITRLQAIKAKRLPIQEHSTQEQLATCAATTRQGSDFVAPEFMSDFKLDELRELREWLEIFRNHIRNAAQSIEMEQKRIHLLEENLTRKPALMALVERLMKIRLNLATPMTSFKGIESECGARISWLSDFEKAIQKIRPNEPLQTADELPTGLTQPAANPLVDIEQNTATVVDLELFLMDISGWRVGIPSTAVVKVNSVGMNKLETIFKRGYANIQDFTTLFRSLKNGLLGKWKEMPLEELKKYQFKVLNLDIPQLETTLPSHPMVALVSNGTNHGMIVTQHADAQHPISAKVTLGPTDGSLFLGRIENEAGLSVTVIDMDKVLSLIEQ